MAITFQVTFDAADPGRLARFWAAALGYVVQPPPEGHDSWEAWATEMGIPEERWNDVAAIVDPDGAGPRIFIQKVPEPKRAKNRVHLDVNAAGGTPPASEERRVAVQQHADRLVGLGAERVELFDEPERGEYWQVMRDPEGNEFCIQ